MKNNKAQEEWDDGQVFRDESLKTPVGKKTPPPALPWPLKKARMLELKWKNKSPHALFYKEAQMLAGYEDDFEFYGSPAPFYTTYRDLSDDELRGYFTWRARVRKGEYGDAAQGFITLYCNELINNIGVETPLAGLKQLAGIGKAYGSNEHVVRLVAGWLYDYIAYYNLDPGLLKIPEAEEHAAITAISQIATAKPDDVTAAIAVIGSKWLKRSRFYVSFKNGMDTVIYKVLKRMDAHYTLKCSNDLKSQFLGREFARYVHLFTGGVFCDPLKIKECEYRFNSHFSYYCTGGIWHKSEFAILPAMQSRFEKLLKTIDRIMREVCAYPHPLKAEKIAKWIDKIIREEANAVLAEKNRLEKNKIDFSRLDKIRADAEITRDRLIVEEEAQPEASGESAAAEAAAQDAQICESALAPDEYRLLQCLLYGKSLDWIRDEGLLLSVLVDSVNEKMYDLFADTVLDETCNLMEDYIAALKEMIPA